MDTKLLRTKAAGSMGGSVSRPVSWTNEPNRKEGWGFAREGEEARWGIASACDADGLDEQQGAPSSFSTSWE
jgi:hypothetical protein